MRQDTKVLALILIAGAILSFLIFLPWPAHAQVGPANTGAVVAGTGITVTPPNTISLGSTNGGGFLNSRSARMSEWVQGLSGLVGWSNVVASEWFSLGDNLLTTNGAPGLVDLVGNVPVAVNCNFSNAGLMFNTNGTSYLVYSNIPPQVGPLTLIIWAQGTPIPNSQLSYCTLGGVFTTTGVYSAGTTPGGLWLETTGGGGAQWSANIMGSAGSENTIDTTAFAGTGGPVLFQDFYPRMWAISTDRTNNLTEVVSGCTYQLGPGTNFVTNITSLATNTGIAVLSNLCLGCRIYNTAIGQTPWAGCLSGFVLLSNYMTSAQIQQVNLLAQNTVLPWRRLVMEGDSETTAGTSGYSVFMQQSNAWPNVMPCTTAITGQTSLQMLNRFWQTTGTNLPNDADVTQRSLVLYKAGQNDVANGFTAAFSYFCMSNEIAMTHQRGGLIAVSTTREAFDTSPTNSYESVRQALNALVRANSAGADAIYDDDLFWLNFLGTNYYTNLTYFADGKHCGAYGNTFVASNFWLAVSNIVWTPDNYHAGPSLQAALAAQNTNNPLNLGGATNYQPLVLAGGTQDISETGTRYFPVVGPSELGQASETNAVIFLPGIHTFSTLNALITSDTALTPGTNVVFSLRINGAASGIYSSNGPTGTTNAVAVTSTTNAWIDVQTVLGVGTVAAFYSTWTLY